jgi:ribosome-associated protein
MRQCGATKTVINMQTDSSQLIISERVTLPLSEIELVAIRSSGPGGQNVNKVASAIQLRFDVSSSSLPDFYKQRLLRMQDSRISRLGIIVIKAQRFRDQERNRQDALERLQAIIKSAAVTQKHRIATKPTRASQKRRLEGKRKQAQQKALRRTPID